MINYYSTGLWKQIIRVWTLGSDSDTAAAITIKYAIIIADKMYLGLNGTYVRHDKIMEWINPRIFGLVYTFLSDILAI